MPNEKPNPLPWWPAPRDRSSDREPLSQEQIVQAALRLIDREGVDAVSMRRLGQELGAGTTSVYWHVKNKDQLLDLVVDAVLGEVPIDDDAEAPWRERVAYLARELRAALVRHGNVAIVLSERITAGPNALAGLDHLIGILRTAGFEAERNGLAFSAIVNYTSGFAILETRQPPVVAEMTPDQVAAMMESILAAVPAERFPNLAAVWPTMTRLTADAQFEYGLQRLLDGIESDLARGIGTREGGSGAAGG